MGEPRPIYDPAAVTGDWLSEVLVHAGVLAADDRVVGVEREVIGTGQVGSNVRFRLRYARGDAATGPRSVVGKFAADDEVSRGAGVATRTYETEVAFYRDLAASVEISRPACYFAAIEPGTADVVLMLEDMDPAVPGDQIAGCSVAEAELVVDEAARLHGPRWGDPTLLDHAWLADGFDNRGGVGELYAMTWDAFLDRYRATLDPAAVEVGTHLRAHVADWLQGAPAALTLTHGDFRLDNMLFRPGALTVVDWQTVRLGCGPADVAYFLGAGLDPDIRRRHERDLVARYYQALFAYDIGDYSFDACWDDYRRHSYGGYVMAVIASILVGRTERGDAMFMAMANRHAAQATDLAAADLLPT